MPNEARYPEAGWNLCLAGSLVERSQASKVIDRAIEVQSGVRLVGHYLPDLPPLFLIQVFGGGGSSEGLGSRIP